MFCSILFLSFCSGDGVEGVTVVVEYSENLVISLYYGDASSEKGSVGSNFLKE